MSEDTVFKLREDIQGQAMDLYNAALDEDPGTIERRHSSIGASIRKLEGEMLEDKNAELKAKVEAARHVGCGE